MHLLPVPTRIRDHDGHDAGVDGGGIALGMYSDQICFADAGITLVNAFRCAAIGEEVFGGRRHMPLLDHSRAAGLALQTQDELAGIPAHELRIFGKSLIRTTPALILGHGECWRESPVNPDHRCFLRRRCRDSPHQCRIARRAKSHVVGKDGRGL